MKDVVLSIPGGLHGNNAPEPHAKGVVVVEDQAAAAAISWLQRRGFRLNDVLVHHERELLIRYTRGAR